MESLVQDTVVGGPPVEIQVRVNELLVSKVKVILPDNVRCPECVEKTNSGSASLS